MTNVAQFMDEISKMGAEAMLMKEPKEDYTQDSITFVRKADLTEDDLHDQSHIRFIPKSDLPTEQELFDQETKTKKWVKGETLKPLIQEMTNQFNLGSVTELQISAPLLQQVFDVNKTIRDDSFYDNVKPHDQTHKLVDDYKRRIELALEQECYQLLDVLPDSLKDSFHTLYIAGGSIYSLYNEQPVKDYDFFGRDEAYLMQLRGFFGQFVEYSSQHIQRGMWKGFKIVITDNAITIGRWQVITNWWGEPKEVVGEFDFKHTQNWYDGSLHLLHGTDYLDDKMLWYNTDRSRDVVGTLLRIPHFISNGFHIRKSEHCKILQKLESEGFSDKDKTTMTSYLDY